LTQFHCTVSAFGCGLAAGADYGAMIKVLVDSSSVGGFYNFLMQSAGVKSFGDYSVAFHIGSG